MDENENIKAEVSEPDNDNSFDEGWDDSSAVNASEDESLEEQETDAAEAEGEPTDQTEGTEEKAEPEAAVGEAANVRSGRDEDFIQFVKARPEVNARDITKEVWIEVRNGKSLLDAYEKYEAEQIRAENRRLSGELEIMRRNNENRLKSAGSQRSAGMKITKPDPFSEGWEEV